MYCNYSSPLQLLSILKKRSMQTHFYKQFAFCKQMCRRGKWWQEQLFIKTPKPLPIIVCDDYKPLSHWPANMEQVWSCWLIIFSIKWGQTKSEQEREQGGRQLVDTLGSCLLSKQPSPRQLFPVAVYTHLIPWLPSCRPSPSCCLHRAPRPSCISVLYERLRGGTEGWGGEGERQRKHRGRIGQCSEA